MNTELLFNLYRVFSPSGNEKKMRKYIKDYIRRLNFADCKVKTDKGNIYVTKGKSDTYPCVVAHMDQVQRIHPKDFNVYVLDDEVVGYSHNLHQSCGLGADDKNGIWVALECLRKFDAIKLAFFWGEEIGCRGSSDADMNFFKDCRFLLQCDRKNGSDLIFDVCGQIASDDFISVADYKDFGYHLEHGLSTDVATLADNGVGISCLNISCGYYNPHTDYETTSLSELQNCLDFVFHIIEKCTAVYPWEMPVYSSRWGGPSYSFWDYDPSPEDIERMKTLLMENPDIAFEDFYNLYRGDFTCKSRYDLMDLYEDVLWSESFYEEDYGEFEPIDKAV